jgi:hypothetical protein
MVKMTSMFKENGGTNERWTKEERGRDRGGTREAKGGTKGDKEGQTSEGGTKGSI